MPIPQIPIYTGDVPQRTQAPEVFSVNADAWLAYQAPLAANYNQLADYLNQYNYADRGFFTPTAQQEYPDTSGVDVNQYFGVVFPSTTDDYTFTSGDLSGVTVTNGATLRYADGSWTYALPYGGGVSQGAFDSEISKITEFSSSLLRAMLGKPVHETIVGRAQDDDLMVPAVGQKLYVADYQTAYEIISQADNFIDEATKAADPFQYAGYWGFGDDGADFFTTPNLPLTMHIKSAGSYGNAGESKEDHLQNITGAFAARQRNSPSVSTYILTDKEGFTGNNVFIVDESSGPDQTAIGDSNSDGPSNRLPMDVVTFDTSRVARTDTFTDSMGTFFDPYIWLPKGAF